MHQAAQHESSAVTLVNEKQLLGQKLALLTDEYAAVLIALLLLLLDAYLRWRPCLSAGASSSATVTRSECKRTEYVCWRWK